MTAAIIGIAMDYIIIFLFEILRQFDKRIIYALILSGIGFLYVGFVWTNRQDLVINIMQAVLFLFIAYYGTQRNIYLLAAYDVWLSAGILSFNLSLYKLKKIKCYEKNGLYNTAYSGIA